MRLARSLLVTPLAIALGSAGCLGLATAQAARADTVGSTLPLTYFHQMAVDSADGYVFLSGGLNSTQLLGGVPASAAASGVVVTSLSGAYVTTLDAGDGVEGIAVNNGELYAALAAKGEVAAIDISTIAAAQPAQASYPLPTGDVPYGLAVQSGDLWVSYNGAGPGAGAAGIGDVGLSSGTFTPATAGSSTWYSAPDLYADPNDSGVLVATQPGITPLSVAAYNTAGSSVTQLAATTDLSGCGSEVQLAVLPGGSQFAATCADQVGAQVYSTTDLSAPVSTFTGPITTIPAAVSVADNGAVAIAAASTDTQSNDNAYVFSTNGTLLNDINLSDTQDPVTAGLGWSADGSELFAVIQTGQGGPYAVRVIDTPSLTQPVLTLTGPKTIVPGGTAAITGTLALTTGGALPAGTTVTITRTGPVAGTPQTVPVAANGTFSLTDTLTQAGDYTYTAKYAGSGTSIAAATASTTVVVQKSTATISLSGATSIRPYEAFDLAGRLSFGTGTPATGTAITVKRTNPNHTTTTVSGIKTSANGAFSIPGYISPLGSYTYTASYAGSATASRYEVLLAQGGQGFAHADPQHRCQHRHL